MSKINMEITVKEVSRYFSKPRNWWILAVIIIAIIGMIVSGYFIFVYRNVCNTDDCFSKAIVNCDKTVYIKNSPETITQYKILGKENGECKVNVKLLQLKQGSIELQSLQNKDMTCLMPLGIYALPEENLKTCTGSLKESIQEIIIQRMHSQLIENIGEISEELTSIL
jgi:hypothetical protein